MKTYEIMQVEQGKGLGVSVKEAEKYSKNIIEIFFSSWVAQIERNSRFLLNLRTS